MQDDRIFLEAIKGESDPVEILNWYRCLYHAEGMNTERGIVALAINDVLNRIGGKI